MPKMDEIVIHVQTHSEEGFEYSIYADREAVEDDATIDGGFFDGTFEEAIDFAVKEAKEIINK